MIDDLRAWSGLEASAFAVAHAVDTVAIVGGEGARRFEHALGAVRDARAVTLPERGEAAASAAVGLAVAGARVALVLSGREAASQALAALRELAALRSPVVVVVPAHGDEQGRAVPEGPFDDLALLFEAPVGVLVAGSAREASELSLAACALASGASMPWCVAFELARVGCAVGPRVAPSRDEAAAWWRAAPDGLTGGGAIAHAWERVTRRAPHLAPVAGACAPGGDVTVRVGGEGTVDASTVRLTQVRPFPSAGLASLCGGARTVVVREPWPDAFAAHGAGRLTTQVRAALAGLASVVGEPAGVEPAHGAARVRLAWNEPARGALVRALVGFAADLGWRVAAEQHEPWAATLVVHTPGADGCAPCDVVVAEAGSLGLLAVIGDSARVERVLLLGACDAARLQEVRDACDARGAALRHEPDATLGG